MKLDILTLDGAKAGTIELSADVFGVSVRKDLMQRVVLWQQARSRAGNASTKGRADVNRTGKKFVRQKGTGGARHGSRRANLFRGGGIVFGPLPRSFAFDLPKKVRALALKCALSSKMASQSLVIVDETKMATHKTKDLAVKLKNLNLEHALFIVDSMDENFDKASRNLPHVRVVPTEGANVLSILKAQKLVLTKNAVDMLQTRLTERMQGGAN